MNHFAQLLERNPLVFFHLVTALAALVLGTVILMRHKGTGSHRVMGRVWVALMAATTIASGFIRDYSMPNIAGVTPLHVFTLVTAIALPAAVIAIRRGNVARHRAAMRALFFGACVLAGIFTLLPGRFLGDLLWKHALGV